MLSYFSRLGIALDEFLNVLLLNGDPEQTISFHAAVAQEQRKLWGCWLCWLLSKLVQPGHCQKQLDFEHEPTSAALRAGFILVLVAGAIVFEATTIWHVALKYL